MPTALAIETRDLLRRFGSHVAVNRLNLQVPKGSIYGFLGPNGAGKTTTIRMLLGLLNPTEGEVLLHGESFTPQRRDLLRSIGTLFEKPCLYPHLSAQENLEVARKILNVPHSCVPDTLALFDLLPEATRPVRSYSLGMKQRLGLALAWLGRPSLLLLDEPANGLDPVGVRDLRELLLRLVHENQTTIFLSSHILSEVQQIADQIGIIDHGRLLYQGGLSDLFRAGSMLEIKVDDPEAAMQVLRTTPWPAAIDEKKILTVSVATADHTALVNKLLVEKGLMVYALGLRQNTLETFYLHLVSQEKGAA